MRIKEPLAFSVQHIGRGGKVLGHSEAGELRLELEMQSEGGFCVWLRGARLATSGGKERPLASDERQLVRKQLRAWLDASGRTSWTLEL